MASIEKRGKRSWRLTVETGYGPNGERLRERKTIVVEDDTLLKKKKKLQDYLEQELIKFKMEVESGEYIKPEKITFREFVDKHWWPKYAETELEVSTRMIYKQHLKTHILPYFGHMRLDAIKNSHVSDFVAYLKTPNARKDGRPGPLGTGTQRYIFRVLRNVFVYATEERKAIPVNPCDGVRWPKNPKSKVEVYSEEEMQAIIDALYKEPDRWRLMILGTFFGGFRRGEILAVELSDLDFENDTIAINENIPMKIDGEFLIKTPKTEESIRKVKMPSWYMRELELYVKEWKKQRWSVGTEWKGGDRQFLFHKGLGLPYHPNTLTRWWRDFLKKNGFRHLRLHGLRHTSATFLLEEGATVQAIQRRLGHSSERTTSSTYLHVTSKMEDKVVQEFDRFKRIPDPQSGRR